MKVAAAQTLVSESVSANGAAIRQAIANAAGEGVKLINFCEGALSGYSKSQIREPDDWLSFDWELQKAELLAIAALCRELSIFAVVGGAHPLSEGLRPHNSLYVISAAGELLTRYDKRFLSHSEISDWYSPGAEPIVFEVDGYRFGCAICIEVQFPEIFAEYERLGVDIVLYSSYGIPEQFQIALFAHAALNCIWISAATPAQKAPKGPSGIIGPNGKALAACPCVASSGYAATVLDRDDPNFDVPLNKARPWRAKARLGEIYRERMVGGIRSQRKNEL